MNHRKIQSATCSGDQHIKIENHRIRVDSTIPKMVNFEPFKFARRAFVGATRIKFQRDKEFYEDDFLDEENKDFTSTDGNSIYLCHKWCQKLLNVGKHTIHFSIWFKVI